MSGIRERMSFTDHFSKQAVAYAESRPTYPKELISFVSNLPDEHNAVLDCATGNGQAAFDLTQHFKQVYATDLSMTQLNEARAHPCINYFAAVSEALPLKNFSVDLVTVAQAWHWFQPVTFEKEILRILKPGGFLAVWGYNLVNTNTEMNNVIQHFYSNVVNKYWPEERSILEQEYTNFPFLLSSILAPEFEMKTEWSLSRLIRYIRSWSATQRLISTEGDKKMKALELKLQSLWPLKQEKAIMSWPLFIKVGRKPI